MSAVIRVALGLVLLAAAAFKLRQPVETRAALATFSIPAGARLATWWTVVAAEAGLGAAVAAGSDAAAYAAAALCAAFGIVLALALVRGRAGAPCACFGARSRVSLTAVARATLLAAAFAAVPSLPEGRPSRDGWLLLGLGLAFVLILALSVAVLALAREVGLLRLRIGEESALEIPGEGPPVGARVGLIERFRPDDRTRFALAVFSSDGCRLCRTLDPVIAAFRHDPVLAVEVFDEVRDADVWRELEIPGSPYAIAIAPDGSVRAKGTFNSYGQLESILATAERRIAEAGA